MDVDSIAIGADFIRAVTEAVSGCVILFALMGPDWSALTDSGGRGRLDDPDDFVRVEIEAALQRIFEWYRYWLMEPCCRELMICH